MAFANIPSGLAVDTIDLLTPRTTVMSELTRVLPPNIHVLTLEAVSTSQLILRLEHFYEKGEHPEYSQIVKISIKKILQALPFVRNLRETTLGGNQWIEKVKRFEWTLKEPVSGSNDNIAGVVGEIAIRPMEIKTYLMDIT